MLSTFCFTLSALPNLTVVDSIHSALVNVIRLWYLEQMATAASVLPWSGQKSWDFSNGINGISIVCPNYCVKTGQHTYNRRSCRLQLLATRAFPPKISPMAFSKANSINSNYYVTLTPSGGKPRSSLTLCCPRNMMRCCNLTSLLSASTTTGILHTYNPSVVYKTPH